MKNLKNKYLHRETTHKCHKNNTLQNKTRNPIKKIHKKPYPEYQVYYYHSLY